MAQRVPALEEKKGLLQRLAEGVVIGDGGMVWALQSRGYSSCRFTAEASVEFSHAVLELHREFAHNGADVLQAFNFWSTGMKKEEEVNGVSLNNAACSLVLQVASEVSDSVLVAGGVTKTKEFEDGKGKDAVQAEFKRQLEFYVKNQFDFVVAEYIDSVVEACWAVEVLQQSGKPVMATLCIGPQGDIDNVSPQECAVRLARAGAHVVGVNCRFGPAKCLQTIAMMKDGLLAAGMTHVHLAVQPFGYHTPDAGLVGYRAMAEYPYALDARCLTRPDAHKYAVEAYKLGVRYIGGCCGFEPRHIRAMSEALQEHGHGRRVAPVTLRYGKWMNPSGRSEAKSSERYWLDMEPATGRPLSAALSKPCPDEEAAYLSRYKKEGDITSS